MRLAVAAFLLVIAALIGYRTDSSFAAGVMQAGCKVTNQDDTVSLDLLRKIATATDPNHAAWRLALGLPDSLQQSEVVFVTDSTRCDRARAAFDSVLGVPDPNRVVRVFQVRDLTGVADTSLIVEGWHLMMVFSPQWALLGKSNWP